MRIRACWHTVGLVLLLPVWLAGCAPPSREELAKEVLKADPLFARVLDQHRELANRLETYARELALKRGAVEQAIAKLRRDLAAATTQVRQKTAEAKQQLHPERERLQLALSMAGEQLQAKQAQRASLGRSIARLRKAIRSAGSVWTEQEQARNDELLNEMRRDAARVDQELVALRAHLRLLKIKLLLIKL